MAIKALAVAFIFTFGLGLAFIANGIGTVQEKDKTDSKQTDSQPEKALAGADKTREAARLTVLANQAQAKGDYDSAYKDVTKACELVSNNYSYHLLRGDISFSAGKITESIAAYDNAIELLPRIEPQLWQRGLALYYADRFADGVNQFETHQTVNSQDVENAVWHLLCASRVSDVDAARKKLIPIDGDLRVPMSQIYEMFAGRMTPEDVSKRAKKTSLRVKAGSEQYRLQLYYAHLYTGLYHEMLKNDSAAITSLKKAEEVNPMGKANFMGQVARIHLQLREAPGKTDEEPVK